MMKAIVNTTIYDYVSLRKNSYVVFDEKIIKTGSMSDFMDEGYEIIDGSGCITMPSLVNAHSHIYSTFARGMSVPFNPQNFVEILEQLWWKLDSHLNMDDIYYSGIVYGVDTLRCGVTTLVDHHASSLVRGTLDTLKSAVVDDCGMRGAFCFETSDRFDVDECIEENVSFYIENKKHQVMGMFGLHASFTLSDETLRKVSDAKGNALIHIHVAESEYDEVHSREFHNKSIVKRLDEFHLISENSLIAHALFVDEEELDIIKERGAKVVFNVSSNMNNSVGIPNYEMFRDKGIDCLIGNDGISSSIVSELPVLLFASHYKNGNPNTFGMNDLFNIFTNNYKYASELLGVKLGKVKEGYEGDLLMIRYENPTPLTLDNAFGHIVFGVSNSFRPLHVFCRGKHVVKDYEVSETLMNKYKEASGFAKKLWSRLEE